MSVQVAFGGSVRTLRGACSTAALVGAMIACTGAESSRNMKPAPTNDSRIAPTSDRELAPTSDSELAPTSDSRLAPTSDSRLAPTGDSRLAPTGDSRLAPTSDSRLAPTGEAKLAPTSESQLAPTIAFDSKRAFEHLRKQVSFGPRPSGTPAIVETRRYIVGQLKAAGITSREQTFIGMTPLGEVSMANVIATIAGKRSERIVLASHFDTKLFREFKFVGANDGASSTAALLELGRVLKARQNAAQNEFTIELLFLDGEEARLEWRGNDNTYGSRHYVEAAQKDKSLTTLKALVLLDMIGDRDLTVRRDANSTPWLVDIVWAAAARLGHSGTFSNELTTIEDDHLPFLRAGVPAVDIIDLDNPTWHTPQDTLEFVSARSLQTVGDVVLAALPDIEKRLAASK